MACSRSDTPLSLRMQGGACQRIVPMSLQGTFVCYFKAPLLSLVLGIQFCGSFTLKRTAVATSSLAPLGEIK